MSEVALQLAGKLASAEIPKALERAFERFSEASVRLESRYNLLRAECEELKSRLKEKDAEIARSARLAMLGETAAAIAHEVRNPLGSIKLFVSILRHDLPEKSDSAAILDEIDKSIAALDAVVSNILQFAKTKTLTYGPVNLHSLIQEQVQRVVPQNRPDLKVTCDLQGNPFIQASETGLRQVFYNLLLNALQAMQYRGDLKVHCVDLDGQSVNVEIQDTGPGVPEELLGRLFEPFVTSRQEGTGLGLAIVRQLIEQHQGRISVLNNGGAVFTINLPRARHSEVK